MKNKPIVRQLFVGNLDYDLVNDRDLLVCLQAAGCPAVQVDVPRDAETGKTRGFAFVEIPASADVQAAVQAARGIMVGDLPIRVEIAGTRKAPGKRCGDDKARFAT